MVARKSCLTFLPGPAWVLLSKICTLFLASLCNAQRCTNNPVSRFKRLLRKFLLPLFRARLHNRCINCSTACETSTKKCFPNPRARGNAALCITPQVIPTPTWSSTILQGEQSCPKVPSGQQTCSLSSQSHCLRAGLSSASGSMAHHSSRCSSQLWWLSWH